MNRYLVSLTIPPHSTFLIFTDVGANSEEEVRNDLPKSASAVSIKLSYTDSLNSDDKVWWLGGRWNDARLLNDYKRKCKRI
jgi:hypothetical protein